MDKTVLLVMQADQSRIGTWVIAHARTEDCPTRILLGPRDDRISVLLAKRAYELMNRQREVESRARGVGVRQEKALLLGVGLPQMRGLEQDQQIELLREIEQFLAEQVFVVSDKDAALLAIRMRELEV